MDLFPDSQTKKAQKATGPHAQAIRAWDASWAAHRGCAFVWSAKDASLMATALKYAGSDLGALRERIERLLSEEDDQWMARNAGPGLLVSHWNQLSYKPSHKPKVGTPLTYVPDRGPRIPPPANLMDLYREARASAQRRLKNNATS
jgi:hypothetical protein